MTSNFQSDVSDTCIMSQLSQFWNFYNFIHGLFIYGLQYMVRTYFDSLLDLNFE